MDFHRKRQIPGYVYLKEDPGNRAYKIGITTSPSRRDREYTSENPHIQHIDHYAVSSYLEAEKIERTLITELRHLQIASGGREWFKRKMIVRATYFRIKRMYTLGPETKSLFPAILFSSVCILGVIVFHFGSELNSGNTVEGILEETFPKWFYKTPVAE